MDSFLNIFGNITIGQVVLFIIAFFFIYEQVKKLIKFINEKHDEKQETELDHERVDRLEKNLIDLDSKIDQLIIGQIELERIRFKELYHRARIEYNDYGFIEMGTAEDLECIYSTYKSLGGNGNLESMHNEITKMPRGNVAVVHK